MAEWVLSVSLAEWHIYINIQHHGLGAPKKIKCLKLFEFQSVSNVSLDEFVFLPSVTGGTCRVTSTIGKIYCKVYIKIVSELW